MSDLRNIFVGIPMTFVEGLECYNIIVRTHVAFKPTYVVIPALSAPDFEIRDIKIGKESQFAGPAAIHASVFSGEVVILKDKVVKAVSDLPLAMEMKVCRPEEVICLTVFNLNPATRNFFGAIVGPPF